MSIQVWQTEDGVFYAAEENQGKIGFYRYDEKAEYPKTHIYGVAPTERLSKGLPADVERAIESGYYKKGLPWIVSLELERAARNQNPIPERSLADAISYPERIKIDAETRDELVHLLGKGCRENTKKAIRYALTGELNLKNYSIYSRLMISPTVGYCAGQDYRAELATIRKLVTQ
jgi:hypothetical protein